MARLRAARKELEKLRSAAEKETREEYDRLLKNAENSLQALDNFEKQKLGMHVSSEEERKTPK